MVSDKEIVYTYVGKSLMVNSDGKMCLYVYT